MVEKIEKKPRPGLQPLVVDNDDMVVNRPVRRAITGIAFNAQRSRLVLDAPDAASIESYPCKIADVSEDGLGVVCPAAAKVPDLFRLGTQLTLEASDGKRSRVQIRWIKHARLGLLFLDAKLM